MMKKFIRLNTFPLQVIIIITALGYLLTDCERSSNKRSLEYFPDMVYSVPYETFDPNPNFPDGKTAQPSVEGTIPREMQPYSYPKTNDGLRQAGIDLKNPFEANDKNFARGNKEYDIFCGICHGKDGRGEGMLFKSGKYPSEPSSLVSKDTWDQPEGEIFHIITMGSAIMDAHASQIRREDRWKIVLYIKRVLQEKEKDRLTKELERKENEK